MNTTNKKYTITLSDGSTIENLSLNGNNFISNTQITEDMFDGKLNRVIISDGEKRELHENMSLVQITEAKGLDQTGKVLINQWWFVLRDISREEIEMAKLRSDVDYLSMMADIDI